MANGIYNDINTKEDYSEMEENRTRMHQIKVWFERTVIVEVISMVYLMFASVIHFMAPVLGAVYLVLLRKKSVKVCKAGVLAHLLIAIIVIITSASYCISAFTADSPSVSLLPDGLAGILTTVPTEEIADSESNKSLTGLFFNSIKAFTVINMLISTGLSLLPVWFSIKAVKYCEMHDELKEKNGYPYFHPDIALQRATEEIEYSKNHKIQADTRSAVTNAELMKKLRDQNVDFKDTNALMAGIIENSGSQQKSAQNSSQALDMVDSMLNNARRKTSGFDKNRFATSDMNSLAGTFGKFAQLISPKKESENSLAMKALVKEAERLRQQKQFQKDNGNASIPLHKPEDNTGEMPEIDIIPETPEADKQAKDSSAMMEEINQTDFLQ